MFNLKRIIEHIIRSIQLYRLGYFLSGNDYSFGGGFVRVNHDDGRKVDYAIVDIDWGKDKGVNIYSRVHGGVSNTNLYRWYNTNR